MVVNPGHDSGGGPTKDPLMQKLEELHFFYPLMHDVERRSGIFGTHNRLIFLRFGCEETILLHQSLPTPIFFRYPQSTTT